MNNTGTFAQNETASGVAQANNISPADFLKYNPDLAATGHPLDYQGLTGNVAVGQKYNLGPSTGPAIVSTSDVHNEAAKNNDYLNTYLNNLNSNQNAPANTTVTTPTDATDPILASLTQLGNNSDTATKSLIAATQAKYQNEINKTNTQYENYKNGLQLLGIQNNEAQSTPDLLAGHIQKAANDQMDKINSLNAEEAKAAIDAKNASDKNQFDILKQKTDYLKQIQTEKANAIKNMYDGITAVKTASADEASAIYSTMQTLDPADQEKYLIAVSKKYSLPLDALTSALVTYKNTQDKVSLANKNAQATLDKKLNPTSKTSTGTVSKAQINQGQNILETGKSPDGKVIGNAIGDDGFVDPSVYLKLFEDWPGTTAQFLTAYPPKDYVNPKATNLPKYLMPITTKVSSGVNNSDQTP